MSGLIRAGCAVLCGLSRQSTTASSFRHLFTTPPVMAEAVAKELEREVVLSQFKKWVVYRAYKGRYASVSQVPDKLPYTTMKKALDRMRAKTLVFMILFSFGSSFVAIKLGQHDIEHGVPGWGTQGMDQIAGWKEKGRLEQEAADEAAKTS